MAGKSEMGPAIHNISFWGLTGAIFVLLSVALVLYIQGFVTISWTITGDKFVGLWQTCSCCNRTEAKDWFLTIQILVAIGLFGLIVSFALATIYMTANRASKNLTLTALVFISFVTAVFALIAVIVFGIEKEATAELSWSFGVTVVAALLIFFAGILTVLQMRRSNVRLC